MGHFTTNPTYHIFAICHTIPTLDTYHITAIGSIISLLSLFITYLIIHNLNTILNIPLIVKSNTIHTKRMLAIYYAIHIVNISININAFRISGITNPHAIFDTTPLYAVSGIILIHATTSPIANTIPN